LKSDEKRVSAGVLHAPGAFRYRNVIATSEKFAHRNFA